MFASGGIEVFNVGDPFELAIVIDGNQELVLTADQADELGRALLSLPFLTALQDAFEGINVDSVDARAAVERFTEGGEVPS